jgi:hypothetical protein
LVTFNIGLRRTGIVWVSPNYAASDIAFSEEYDSPEHPPSDDDIRYLANQVFFFLKDISHVHRHHPPGSDTITEVARLDARKTWAIDTHYRMHRKIVEMRRSKDPKALYKTTGLLAYLSAFSKAIPSEWGRRGRGPLTYNNVEIEASIRSSIEVIKWDQTQKNIIKTALPALLLAAIAVAGYDYGSFGGDVRSFVNEFFSHHPGQAMAILIGLSFSLPFYYGVADFWSLPPILRAKRILVSATKPVHAAFWLGGAALFFGVAFGELALAWLMHFQWAVPIRSHPRTYSWVFAIGVISVEFLVMLLLPFWATRRDLSDVVARGMGHLFRHNKGRA